MKRCDKPANILYPNGFRACSECSSKLPSVHGMDYSETPYGPCDVPAESEREFWSRYPESRKYQTLMPEDIGA